MGMKIMPNKPQIKKHKNFSHYTTTFQITVSMFEVYSHGRILKQKAGILFLTA